MDLNADLGEGFGVYAFGEDESLLGVNPSAVATLESRLPDGAYRIKWGL